MKKTFVLLTGFICILLLCNCSKSNDSEADNFNLYYQKFQDYNHADYKTLVSFYHDLDSVSSLQNSDLLLFLKKTTVARLNFREGDYQKSNKNYNEANLHIAHLSNIDSLLAINYLGTGVNFMNMGSFDSTFNYFRKALVIYDSLDNKKMCHVIYANMAQTYYNKREPEKALEMIAKVVDDSANTSIKLTTLHLKANIWGSSGALDSAITLDRETISKYGQDKNNYLISSFYNNLGMCFLEKGMIDTALFYCKKSYQIDSLSGIKINMGANLVLMGNIYSETGKLLQAKEYYAKALKIFSEDSNIEKKYWIFETLAKVAKQEENLSQVVIYQDSMLTTYKKMNSLEVNRTIELLNIEYETAKKNQQIEIQETQLREQKLGMALTITITLLIIASLYFYFQNKNKKNKLRIAEQDRKVSTMLVEAEQNERSRIARDLHDSVSQKLAVMQMHLSMVDTQQTETVENISSMLQQTITDVRGISHNLYPKDLDKGIVAALEHVCEQNNFINNEIKFIFKTDESISKYKLAPNIELVIYRIVQEITNNALKYSKAKNVTIELAVRKGQIFLKITDDGVGFNINALEQVKGIGLKNIFDRIKQISGKVTISSKEKEGTQFFIEIPA